MNNFIRKSITPRRAAYFLFAFLLVITVVSLVVNRGFYYTYYHKSLELTLTGEVPSGVWNELRTYSGVSKLDAAAKTIRLQGVTYNEANAFVDYLEQKGTDDSPIAVSVAETQAWIPNDVALRAILVALILAVVSAVYLYFTIWRKLLRVNRRIVSTMIAVYMGGLVTSVLFTLGVLSLASRVYELTEISMFAVLLTFICGVSFVYLSSRLLSADLAAKHSQLKGLYLAVSSELASLYKFAVAAATVTLLVVGFGLGVKFAFDGLLLWLSVGLIVLNYSSMNTVLVEGLDGSWTAALRAAWRRVRSPRSKGKKKQTKSSVYDNIEVSSSSKPAKSKLKKTGAVQRRRGR